MNIQSTRGDADDGLAKPVSSAAVALRRATGINPRLFLRILNRRKWLILAVISIIVALAFVGIRQITPLYSATAYLMLDARKTKVTNMDAVVSSMLVDATAVQNEIEIIKSRAMAAKVVQKLDLLNDPEFNPPPTQSTVQRILTGLGFNSPNWTVPVADGLTAEQRALARTVDRLLAKLTVTPRGRSFVIAVRVESESGLKSAAIANTFADFYLIDQLETKFEITRRATDWLRDKLGDLRSQVEKNEKAVADFRERNRLTEARGSTVVAQQIGEINTQLTLAKAQTAEKEARFRQVQDLARSPTGLDSVGEVTSSALISRLREQEAELQRREGEFTLRYGANHPRMMNLRSEAADLKRKIQEEVARIAQGLNNELRVAQARQAALQQQLDRLERQSGDLGQASVTLRQLEREAESSRLLYENFLNRAKESREQEDLQQADARVISRAEIPTSSSYPRSNLALGAAFVFSVIFAGVVVYLFERLDGGFRSTADIEEQLGVHALGAVPLITNSRRYANRPQEYLREKPTSHYAEGLRSVFTAITLSAIDEPPKVIMVTSSVPSEGKSTFAVSLAAQLAGGGGGRRKVVLVDLDLRRPSISKLAKTETRSSIDQYLMGSAEIGDILAIDSASGVHVIAPAKSLPNPGDLLDSRKIREFVAGLSEVYDIVLIDTPPVGAVSDARVIAGIADFVVFLVRWERTPREIVAQSVRSIREASKRMGVVLSQVHPRRQSYYDGGAYYYSTYKGYYRN